MMDQYALPSPTVITSYAPITINTTDNESKSTSKSFMDYKDKELEYCLFAYSMTSNSPSGFFMV